MNELIIPRLHSIRKANVQLPASKSISNRLLILDFLYGNNFTISNLSKAEDTVILSEALHRIKNNASTPLTLNLKNAGTAVRFLTALLATRKGEYILTGNKYMLMRPIKPLVDALQALGAEISYLNQKGFLPIRIIGTTLYGGELSIDASMSSQYVSALMMIAPSMKYGLDIKIKAISSFPYIKMTYKLMKQLGFRFLIFNNNRIHIPPQKHTITGNYKVSSDWTSASYWYALVALFPHSSLILQELSTDNIQGDEFLIEFYHLLNVHSQMLSKGIEIKNIPSSKPKFIRYNFNDTPDISLSIIVNLCLLGIPFEISGLENLHIKESDRIKLLRENLKNLGYKIIEISRGVLYSDCKHSSTSYNKIYTASDHRIAMAFSQFAILKDIIIDDSQCIEKSYPQFWNEFFKVAIF